MSTMRPLSVIALLCLLSGCAARHPAGPGGFAAGSGPSIGPTQASFIAELFDDAQGTITKDFPLSESMRIDTLSGTISFHRLNGHCKGKDIATVGFLSNGSDNLAIWDFQNEVDAPIYAYFPGGIAVSKLHFESYSDLCLPTDFRLALTLHRLN